MLAIGGGSTIGAAKAVAMTARLPIVAVPTTYAGSEITPIWGLTEEGHKQTGVDPVVLPRVVIYDPTLTATLPPDLAAASGFNALAHAVEAMWAPGRNPVSTAVAAEAVERLANGLRTGDPAELLCGAWLGSSAFAVAGSGLHHKLCHVLGGTFGLPHARTHAVVLPHVLAFNAPGAPDAVEPGGPGARRRRRGRGAARPRRRTRHPARASGRWGCRKPPSRKPPCSRHPPCPPDNPVPVTDESIRALVRAAWSGSDAVVGTETRRHQNGDSPS